MFIIPVMADLIRHPRRPREGTERIANNRTYYYQADTPLPAKRHRR
jgi:hypothetical protein